jgi:peroxiredoxin
VILLAAASLAAADFTIGQDAPDFELGTNKWNTPEGFKKLSSFRGKVVLIELWATY